MLVYALINGKPSHLHMKVADAGHIDDSLETLIICICTSDASVKKEF